MSFLYLLEKIRNPFFDFLFLTITHLGEELAFLAIGLIFFWCVNKRHGYFLMLTGFFGSAINQFMKITFKVKRPWVIDKNFKPVSGAIEEATGYSFPSGHTQTACGTFGVIAVSSKKRWIKVTAIVIAALVAFSRMYLGVHTPWDVLASIGIAAMIIVILEPFFSSEEKFRRAMPFIIGAIILVSAGYMIYSGIVYYNNPVETNTVSGYKSGCMLLGCALGFIPVYILDTKYTNFSTGGKWYSQIIKVVLGLAITVAIKELLKLALLPLMGQFYERMVRYFIIVIFAGCVWPLTFKYFEKLQIPALDKFASKILKSMKSWFKKLKKAK